MQVQGVGLVMRVDQDDADALTDTRSPGPGTVAGWPGKPKAHCSTLTPGAISVVMRRTSKLNARTPRVA